MNASIIQLWGTSLGELKIHKKQALSLLKILKL